MCGGSVAKWQGLATNGPFWATRLTNARSAMVVDEWTTNEPASRVRQQPSLCQWRLAPPLRGVNADRANYCRRDGCDPRGWTMSRGRPHASWLRQVESYLKFAGMAGLASAWTMARRRPKEYRRKVDAATRCSCVCPHT